MYSNRMKIALPLLLLLVASSAFSQTDSTHSALESQTTDELRAKAKKLKLNKEVLVAYDKFKYQSGVTTKPFNLIGGGESFAAGMVDALSRGPHGTGPGSKEALVLMVNVLFYFDGQTLENTPQEFLLLFSSGSTDWFFLKGDGSAYFLIDGERLKLEPKDRDSEVSGRNVIEPLGYEI